MAMMDDNHTLFVDTNILIYASSYESPFHQRALDALKKTEQRVFTYCYETP